MMLEASQDTARRIGHQERKNVTLILPGPTWWIIAAESSMPILEDARTDDQYVEQNINEALAFMSKDCPLLGQGIVLHVILGRDKDIHTHYEGSFYREVSHGESLHE